MYSYTAIQRARIQPRYTVYSLYTIQPYGFIRRPSDLNTVGCTVHMVRVPGWPCEDMQGQRNVIRIPTHRHGIWGTNDNVTKDLNAE